MTKPTASQIARFRAISSNVKAGTAANDDAPKPKGRLTLQDFVATVEFDQLKDADDAKGKPYYSFKDANVRAQDGKESVRTVMVFEAYDLVKKVVLAGQELVVTLRHAGPTLKVVGVQVDGEMVIVEQPAAIAA